MKTLRQAAQAAVGVLGDVVADYEGDRPDCSLAIDELEAALAFPKQFPLTEAQIRALAIDFLYCDDGFYTVEEGGIMGWLEFARRVEDLTRRAYEQRG